MSRWTGAPSGEMRPGPLGTLVDERADVVDVTATVVDLAVRGHLRIEELGAHMVVWRDWRLVRLEDAPDDLAPFERALLDKLFGVGVMGRRQVVRLSELQDTFADSMDSLRRSLEAEVVRRGWFRDRPGQVRLQWYLTAAAALVAALGVAALLIAFTRARTGRRGPRPASGRPALGWAQHGGTDTGREHRQAAGGGPAPLPGDGRAAARGRERARLLRDAPVRHGPRARGPLDAHVRGAGRTGPRHCPTGVRSAVVRRAVDDRHTVRRAGRPRLGDLVLLLDRRISHDVETEQLGLGWGLLRRRLVRRRVVRGRRRVLRRRWWRRRGGGW
ncbi:MAG TPA: hypothetical protein VFR74_15115 [Jiangellales bacterium]|nr:hypothetical protein [Jiangellales bacterium]